MTMLVFLFFINTANADTADPHINRQVLTYCQQFAEQAPGKISGMPAARYITGSAKIKQSARAARFLSNFFQPRNSRFADGWQCAFQVAHKNQTCTGEVALPMAEYLAFAEHTQWPKLMIVPNNHITTADGDTAGYLTPKYYELKCKTG